MLEKNYLWRIYWQLAGRHHGVRRDGARRGVVLLAPRVRARARPRDRAEGRHRGRLGARAGAQGDQLRHRLRLALRRRADLRRGASTRTPSSPTSRSPTPTGSVLFARGNEPDGARDYFRRPAVLADRCRAARDAGRRLARGPQYIVSMPIVAPDKPLGVLHIGIDSAVRRPRAARGAARRRGGARGVALLHARAAQLHGGRAPRLGPGRIRAPGRAHEPGDFTATARIRANDEIGRLLRRIDAAIDHLNVRYEFLVGELRGQAAHRHARAARAR